MNCVIRWNQFRQKALDQQNLVDETLMRLQKNELSKLKEWMSQTEDKISR